MNLETGTTERRPAEKRRKALADEAQPSGDREIHVSTESWDFLYKVGFFRKTTFSAVVCLVSSIILILSTFVFHKMSSTNGKMNAEPHS